MFDLPAAFVAQPAHNFLYTEHSAIAVLTFQYGTNHNLFPQLAKMGDPLKSSAVSVLWNPFVRDGITMDSGNRFSCWVKSGLSPY